jgi:transcriptional regulator with XRE-family HTH domain
MDKGCYNPIKTANILLQGKMQMNSKLLTLKAKKFGVRLAGFRQKKGVSTETLSQWTGIPIDELKKIECGESTISLPLIELIALKLGLMTDTLLAGELENHHNPSTDDSFRNNYSALRDRMISLTLRKTRQEQKKNPETVAEKCGLTVQELEQFETGRTSIPWPILECLCEEYQLQINSLITDISHTEIKPKKEKSTSSVINHLPEPIREFVQNSANLPYLELARRLSEMDAAKLRGIAEGLLEITY